MQSTKRKVIAAMLIILAMFMTRELEPKLNAQQVDPSYQINWPTGPTACVYMPGTNACMSAILSNPGFAQSVTQPSLSAPLSVNYLSPMFVNGAVEAAAFCGSGTVGGITLPACSADACHKLLAANQYSVANGNPLVDASGFTGTQACTTNPYALGVSIGAPVFLVNRFGATHFQTTVVWEIVNSGVSLLGSGPFATQVEYTGSSCTSSPGTCAVLWLNTDAGSGTGAEQGGPNGMVVRDMLFYGDNANVYDGVILEASRSRFDNVYTWGVVNCGIRLHGAEENTFTHPVVSNTIAFFLGIDNNATHTTPNNGLCMDEDTAQGTNSVTSTTISDPIMEGTTGIGIYVLGGNNVVITGGTSESNATNGMVVNTHGGVVNQQITVIGTDFEGNGSASGSDVTDNGAFNTYIGILATSNNSSVFLNGNGTEATDLIFNGLFGPSGGGVPSGVAVNGIPAPGGVTSGTCTNVATMTQEFRGNTIYVPYCSTAP